MDADLPFKLEEVPCLYCGSSDSELVDSARDYLTDNTLSFHVVQCRDCGLAYTSPRPVFADLLKYFYPEEYVCYEEISPLGHWRERQKYRARMKVLDPFIPKKGRILDIGCGRGEFLSHLKKLTDWELFACEPKQEITEKVSSRGIAVQNMEVIEAGFAPNFFNAITMSHTLEHVPDPMNTLREIYRILEPGGIFLSEQPDFGSSMRKIFRGDWWGYHLPRHLTHFDFSTLTRSLKNVGFEIKYIRSCIRPACSPWSFQIWLERRGFPKKLAQTVGNHSPLAVFGFLPIELIIRLFGHTDAMEVLAKKPDS
jgi:SAM-dependent methyltransferase